MKKTLPFAAIAVAALAISGCAPAGGTDPGANSDGGSTEEVIELKVGLLPIIHVAAFEIAQQQGFFEEEGLKVESQMFNAGAAGVAALMSGDIQIAWSAVTSDLNALSQGVPILAVAPGAYAGVGDQDSGALVVRGDSDIKTIADLEGKTVSIVAQQSLAHLETLAALDKNGVDLKSVNYVEIAFPDIGGAIASGRIDSGSTVEPFRSILLEQGMRKIGAPATEAYPEATQTTEWVTSAQYAAKSPEGVERFQRAMAKANEYATANPDDARAAIKVLIPTINDETLGKMILPQWKAEIGRDSYDRLMEMLKKYGGYTYEANLDEYLRLTDGS